MRQSGSNSPSSKPGEPEKDAGVAASQFQGDEDPQAFNGDSRVGRTFVGLPATTFVALLLAAATVVLVYALIAAWPATTAPANSASVQLFGAALVMTRDQQLFLIVAIAGALGGLIHSMRSLYWYAGNRVLRRSWLLMYLSLPLVGAALSIVFCLILRGGLITGESSTAQVNFFGFTAVAALVGLFSPEAAEKLKQIFSTMLAPAQSGRDRVVRAAGSVVTHIEPDTGPAGTLITVHGHGLSATSTVLFHGASAPVVAAAETRVAAIVPEGASTGAIRLAVGDRIVTVPGLFQVETADAIDEMP